MLVDMASTWFSATMLLVILVEDDTQPPDHNRVAHIFQADGWDVAFQRSLDLGRSHETDYLNGDGKRVRWRLVEVATLDMLADKSFDGAEVFSALHQARQIGAAHPTFDTVFEPEKTAPGHSGL